MFSRQLFLGDNLDTERVHAEYHAGVLRLTIPVSRTGQAPQEEHPDRKPLNECTAGKGQGLARPTSEG